MLMSFSGPLNLASGGFLTAPPLLSNCSNPPFGTQGRSWRLESCLQEPGPGERWQKGLCAREPHRTLLVFRTNKIEICTHIQSYLVLLQFALLCFTDTVFFTNWRFVATLRWASLLAPFFQHRICSLRVSVAFWHFSQYFKPSAHKKIKTHWRLRWWLAFFLAIKYF